MKKDIKIAGGGISGLTSAIVLAKNGFAVTVYEKNSGPGMRFNGDFQGIENWTSAGDALEEFKSYGLEINFKAAPFKDVIFTNFDKTVNHQSEKPLFYLVKRGNFLESIDYGLYRQALAAGVKVLFNRTITEKEADIIATGPNPKEIMAIASGITFETSSPDIAVGITNEDVCRNAYAYLLISDGHGCICSVLGSDFPAANQLLDNAVKTVKEKFKVDIKKPQKYGGFGSSNLRGKFFNGKNYFVGEAAGLQDMMAGFGMRSAIRSGQLAAHAIIKSQDYQNMAVQKFSRYLRAGIINRYLWTRFAKNNYKSAMLFMSLSAKSDWLIRYLYNTNIGPLFSTALRKVQKTVKYDLTN